MKLQTSNLIRRLIITAIIMDVKIPQYRGLFHRSLFMVS